jgi:hypothetical protein
MNSHPSKPRRPYTLLTIATLVAVLTGVAAISYALDGQNRPVKAPVSVLLAQFGGFGNGGGNQGGNQGDDQGGNGGYGDQGGNGGYGDQGDEPPPPPRRNQPRRKGPSQRQPRQPAPNRGALDQLVQRTVGDFELKAAQRDNNAIQQGAIDALQMQYEDSQGVRLGHYLIALQSPDQAKQGAQNLANEFQQKFQLSGEGDVKTSEGKVQGHIWVFHSDNGEEAVLWYNAQIIALAGSAEGYAVQFMKDLPY